MITARKGNSIKLPCIAGAVQRELKQQVLLCNQGLHSTMVDILRTVWLEKEILVCVCTCTHVWVCIYTCIYNCTQQIYMFTHMQKYIQVPKVYHHCAICKFNCLNILTHDA